MMGALDQKYRMAIGAINRAARNSNMSPKEFIVRMASKQNLINIPLWNEQFDEQLIQRSKGGAK